jgi:hypothetical protein
VKVLNPRRLNVVFNYAHKFELSVEGQMKRRKVMYKSQPFLKDNPDRRRVIRDNKDGNMPTGKELVPYKKEQPSYN